MRRKNDLSFENRGNLEVDEQGGDDAPIRAYGMLGCSHTDMGPLVLAKMGDY
jgi:hypothetical protein